MAISKTEQSDKDAEIPPATTKLRNDDMNAPSHYPPKPSGGKTSLSAICRKLSVEYYEAVRSDSIDWSPAWLIALGVMAAIGLSAYEIRWAFAGLAFSSSAIVVLLLFNFNGGCKPLLKRIAFWPRRWPWWEWLMAPTVVALVCGFIHHFDAWLPSVVGSGVGIGFAALIQVAFVMPSHNRGESVRNEFNRLLANLDKKGVDAAAFQSRMPSFSGERWAWLFESHYGYEAYGDAIRQLAYEYPSLSSPSRPVRDHICDVLDFLASKRWGPTAASFQLIRRRMHLPAAAWRHSNEDLLGMDLYSASLSEAVADNEQPLRVDPAGAILGPLGQVTNHGDKAVNGEAHANMQTSTTGNVQVRLSYSEIAQIANAAAHGPYQPGETVESKKARYDRMLWEAWASDAKRAKQFPILEKLVGRRSRQILGFTCLLGFGYFLVQSGILSNAFFTQLRATFSNLTWNSIGAASKNIGEIIQLFSSRPQTLQPLGVSGWGLGVCAVLFGAGSRRFGWANSMFLLPAALLILVGMSINHTAVATPVLMIAAVILIAGYLADGWIVDQVIRGIRNS